MFCKLTQDTDGRCYCAVCGWDSRKPLTRIPRVVCKTVRPATTERYVEVVREAAAVAGVQLPLGDWTAAGLEALGITKERFATWTGGESGCGGCEKRQAWLNNIGAKLAEFVGGKLPPAD